MQSVTHTLVITQPPIPTATLHLVHPSLTPRQRLEAIVTRLLGLPLIEAERTVITNWMSTINYEIFDHLDNEEIRDIAAHALVDLLCAGLHPLAARLEDTDIPDPVAQVLLDVDDTLTALLAEVLPEGENVDAFIKAYIKSIKQLADTEASRERVRRATAAIFAQLQELEQAYNNADARFVAQFENFRQRVIQFNRGREATVTHLEGVLIELTNAHNHLVDRSVAQVERSIGQSRKIDDNQKEINQLMERCNAALNNAT